MYRHRVALASAIVIVHALGLWLLAKNDPAGTRSRRDLESAEALMVLETVVPVASQTHGDRRPTPFVTREPPGIAIHFDQPGSLSPPGGSVLPENAATDWSLEAHIAADDVVDSLVKKDGRKCDDSPKRPPWIPPCKRHRGRFEWNEEPQRAGFKDGLPYLRLGRNCLLVAGFIGCSLGKPEANGRLFDDMRDPDRDRSSVPDTGEINEPVDNAPGRRSVLFDPPVSAGATPQ